MNDVNRRLKQIKVENYIWIIYFFIIGLSLYGNKLEKNYFLYNNQVAKNSYRTINTIVFIVAVVIYIYFFLDNYQDYKDLKPYDSKKKKDLTTLSLVGSTLILISGIIFLYIIIDDPDINVEVAFN